MIAVRKIFRDTVYKIKNKLSPAKVEYFKDDQITSFRNDIKIHFKEGNYSESWKTFSSKMKESFLSKNPSDFLQWDIIKYTITSFNSTLVDREYNAIKLNRNFFNRWNKLLIETSLGSPDRFWKNRDFGTNKIHQTYHLLQLYEKTSKELAEIGYVLEFGGGYGNMCSIFNKINPSVKYTIFDLPELLCLQKFYLNSLGLKCDLEVKNNITLTKNIDLVKSENEENTGSKLFIATWSLSESPFELRNEFIPVLRTFEFILIAYQKDFDGMSNIEYFKTFKEKLDGFSWIEYPVITLSGSFYLIGKRK